jgi:hypothetical protein
MDGPFCVGLDHRLVRQRGGPAREDGDPSPLRGRERAGVVDVDAGADPHQLSTPQHPADLLGRDVQLEKLPPCDDAVLQR